MNKIEVNVLSVALSVKHMDGPYEPSKVSALFLGYWLTLGTLSPFYSATQPIWQLKTPSANGHPIPPYKVQTQP